MFQCEGGTNIQIGSFLEEYFIAAHWGKMTPEWEGNQTRGGPDNSSCNLHVLTFLTRGCYRMKHPCLKSHSPHKATVLYVDLVFYSNEWTINKNAKTRQSAWFSIFKEKKNWTQLLLKNKVVWLFFCFFFKCEWYPTALCSMQMYPRLKKNKKWLFLNSLYLLRHHGEYKIKLSILYY